jgi:signal transduction histidine kinase
VLGAATFFLLPARPLGDIEVSLSEDVARRMALAVENARLYAESREAILLRDKFLSIASHELRTPLTALRLQARTLLRDAGHPERPLGPEEFARKARAISRQVERLSQLVDELLDISRLAQGYLSFQLEDVDLAEVVRDVAASFREDLASPDIRLVLAGLDAPVVGQWNRLRLEQVIINLLTNALKYGRGRPISLELEKDEEHVWLT